MKKKINLTLSILFYIFALLGILFYVTIEFTKTIMLSELGSLFFLGTSCIFLYFGAFFLSKKRKNNQPMKINLWIFFFMYLLLLITLTLFDPMWGRNGLSISWSFETFKQYLDTRFNIIPFTTIFGYLKSFDSLYATRTIFYNLLGNFVAFMPMAFFLPLLFPKQKKWKNFVLTIVFMVLGIELTQLITLSGSCDIDDLILNVSGACLFYGFLNIPTISAFIKNIFLLEKQKLSKKELLKILGFVVVIVGFLFGLVILRDHKYQKNLEEYQQTYALDIEVIDKRKECGVAEAFYEDEYYIYSLPCGKSDEVYVKIKKEKTYSIKEIWNQEEFKDRITIDTLKDAGLDVTKERKYQAIEVSGKGNVSPSISISDPKIIKVEEGEHFLTIQDSSEEPFYELYFFLIPLKEGKTEVEIRLNDMESNRKISSKRYLVTVDEQLHVLYEEI